MLRELPARRAGYTLLEILVLLAISGIIVSVVFQALLGQTGLARLTGAREEVQQNARSAMELVSSELRAVTPHAIRMAHRDSIRYYQPRTWGVLCQPVTLVAPGAGVPVLARFPAGTVPADFGPNRPAWGIGVARETDPAVVPAAYGEFRPTSTLPAGATCAMNLEDAPGTEEVGLAAVTLPGMPMPFAAAPGVRVYLFEEVGYRAREGRMERLMGYLPGPTPDWQELSGPLDGADGLVFRYFRADGSEITASPVPLADLRTIARIGVSIRTQSTSRFAADTRQTNQVSTLVYLRNR